MEIYRVIFHIPYGGKYGPEKLLIRKYFTQSTFLTFLLALIHFEIYKTSPKGIKLITRLRLGLSHLREHKFLHNFQDTLNPICSCGDDIETTVHYLLHCPNYLDERRTLLDNLRSIGENIQDKNDSQISELLLFGVSSNNDASNTCVLNATIQFISATRRFDVPLTYS